MVLFILRRREKVAIAGTVVLDVHVFSEIRLISSSRLDVDIAAIVLGRQAAISAAAKRLEVRRWNL